MQTLPDPTKSPEQASRDLVQHGVAFLADFLDAERTAVIRNRVLEQAALEISQGVAETSETGSASELMFGNPNAEQARFQAVSFLPNKGRVFLDLMQDQRILDCCTAAFAQVPFYLAAQTATIVRNGAKGQVIHTDQQAWPFLTPVPIMLNFVLALSDFTPDMGSTRFVTGTKDGAPPRIGIDPATGLVGNLDAFDTLAPTLKAGSLAMWDARLWHGQGASTSDEDRIAIIMSFVMHMVRAQDNLAASLHDNVYAELTDTEKRLLGFEVHYEYAGRVAPRHAGDTRANTNFAYPHVPELRAGSAARATPQKDMRIGHAATQAQLV